jgi:hypothetical protein
MVSATQLACAISSVIVTSAGLAPPVRSVRRSLVNRSRAIDDRVGSSEDRRGRAVVLLKRHDARRRREELRKIQNVAHARGAKSVYRLGVVADDGQAVAVGLETEQDRGLERIGVLVLVDEDMIELSAHRGGQLRYAHELGPVEQQVVVIEDVLALLGYDKGFKQRA